MTQTESHIEPEASPTIGGASLLQAAVRELTLLFDGGSNVPEELADVIRSTLERIAKGQRTPDLAQEQLMRSDTGPELNAWIPGWLVIRQLLILRALRTKH